MMVVVAGWKSVRSVQGETRNVSFRRARPGGRFDATSRFSRVGAEQNVDPGNGLFVVFAFATHITYPGGEVRDRDKFLP